MRISASMSMKTDNFKDIAARMASALGKGVHGAAQEIMNDAKKRTPVKTGALRASGTVSEPMVDGKGVYCELRFGGAAASYAIFVHERTNARHPVGEAKFLENAVIEGKDKYGGQLASIVSKVFG